MLAEITLPDAIVILVSVLGLVIVVMSLALTIRFFRPQTPEETSQGHHDTESPENSKDRYAQFSGGRFDSQKPNQSNKTEKGKPEDGWSTIEKEFKILKSQDDKFKIKDT